MKAWQSQITVNAIEVLAEDIHAWAKTVFENNRRQK